MLDALPRMPRAYRAPQPTPRLSCRVMQIARAPPLGLVSAFAAYAVQMVSQPIILTAVSARRRARGVPSAQVITRMGFATRITLSIE
jgi:hypothetical protein